MNKIRIIIVGLAVVLFIMCVTIVATHSSRMASQQAITTSMEVEE